MNYVMLVPCICFRIIFISDCFYRMLEEYLQLFEYLLGYEKILDLQHSSMCFDLNPVDTVFQSLLKIVFDEY